MAVLARAKRQAYRHATDVRSIHQPSVFVGIESSTVRLRVGRSRPSPRDDLEDLVRRVPPFPG